VGRNGCYVASINEQTEEEEKRIFQEGSEWCSFSDIGCERERGRRSLLKESLGIVVVITSSVIMVQRIEQERIHYGIYLGCKDIFRFQGYIYLSLSSDTE